MGLRRRAVVERLRSGGYRLNVDPAERDLVARLLGELRDVLTTGDPASPGLRRLFPAAYHADPDADAEYQRLMREELVASRLAGIEAVRSVLAAGEMGEDELYALMQAVNALRLLLGTMLDIGEEHDPRLVDDDDPHAAELHLYDYLSWLLEHVVAALSGS